MSGAEGWDAVEAVEVAAPPERVWAIVADIERHPALAGSGEVLAIRMSGPLAVGMTFEGEIKTGEYGSFTARCVVEEVVEPTRLAWVSYPPLEEGETEEHQIEVHWTFDLAPGARGTRVAHTFRIPAPEAGADELAAWFERTDRLATVRRGMVQTLENVKLAAELPSSG